MKFKNNGGGDNAFNLSIRFVDTLLADTGLIPISKQLMGDEKNQEKKRKGFRFHLLL